MSSSATAKSRQRWIDALTAGGCTMPSRTPTLKEQGWYHTPAHRRWRKLVMQRDHYQCQECKRKGMTPIPLATEAHHKIPIDERPDLALDINNGEGLCWDCHELTKKRTQKHIPAGVRIIKA
jgi:HNH endonuclease.